MSANENRPGVTSTGAASNELDATNVSAISLPNAEECIPAAEAFRGAYAVLVQGKNVRRHLYLNLPAATRARERARARGDRAELVLVRLVPVDGRHLDLEAEAVGEC